MWELDHKEGWVPKNWCLWTLVLKKTLESPFNSKDIKPVNLKWNQPWILIGRTDAEAEVPIIWPHDKKGQLIGKGSGTGKDCGQEEKWVTEDGMVGWYHRFNRHELGQTSGDSEGQRGLVCCSQWGCKELDMTWRLNNSNNILKLSVETLKTYKVMQFSFLPSWHENVYVNYNNCVWTKRIITIAN